MSFSLTSIAHGFARAGKEIVHEAKVVAGILAKITTPEVRAEVEAATKMLLPGNPVATQIEDLAFDLLGRVLKLATDTANAPESNQALLNLGFDQQEVLDIADLAKTVTAAKSSIISAAPVK